jgi:beta-glucanase (GH16 family)
MKAVRNTGRYTNIPANVNGRNIEWIGGTMTSDPATGGNWTYGYFEFRARLPVHGRGMFPALWMYRSPGFNDHNAAEFDLMEIFGNDGQPWNTTLHGPQNESIDGNYAGYYSDVAGWHRYGVDWQPNYVAFYRDGVEYARRTGWIAEWFRGANMGIRMDYAANPNFNGNQSNGNTPNPLYMEVDYVRVYKTKPGDLRNGTGDPYQ